MNGLKGSEPSSAMKLKLLSCDHSTENHPGNTCKLTFKRNFQELVLYIHSKADQKKWLTALIPLTIQSDFHTRFIPVKTIGKGSFAKVLLAFLTTLTSDHCPSTVKHQGLK